MDKAMNQPIEETPNSAMKPGRAALSLDEAEITSIDREERRISMSIRAIRRRHEKEAMAEFMEESGTAITFGDLLRQKMDGGEQK